MGKTPADSKCCPFPDPKHPPAAMGPGPWCNASGTHCKASPAWLVGKMAAYWAWAQAEPAIQGVSERCLWLSARYPTVCIYMTYLTGTRPWPDQPLALE